jgi:hypothetical protein
MKLRSILATAMVTVLLAPGVHAASPAVTGQVTFPPLSATNGEPGAVLLTYEIPGGWKNDFHFGVGRESLTYSLSGPDETLSGSASGLDDVHTWAINAKASASFADGEPNLIDAKAFSGAQAFTLSPHTGLTVTVTTRRTWSVDPGASFNVFATDAYLVLAVQDPLGPINTYATPGGGPLGSASYDITENAIATYANNNAASVTGSVELYADVLIGHAGSPVSPVPEPGPFALYAAGLPLLLALRHRARRRTHWRHQEHRDATFSTRSSGQPTRAVAHG